LDAAVRIDCCGVVAFVEQRLYSQLFLGRQHAFIVQTNQLSGFACKHATVDKCKFSHEEISKAVVTCRYQWKQINRPC